MPKSELPREYLEGLEKNLRGKLETDMDPAQRILMYSGARLNWIGEYINDESVHWELKHVPVDNLTLTGTSPEWNAIIIDRAEKSPTKLRLLMKDSSIAEMFKNSEFVDIPILVRNEEGTLKILDGMNRAIAAVRDGIDEIQAYIGTREGHNEPIVEAHVVYDFLKAYQQGRGTEEDLRGGLRFLLDAYSNVRELLNKRFSPDWVRDERLQKIIQDVLKN
jgi:hypothetical protein